MTHDKRSGWDSSPSEGELVQVLTQLRAAQAALAGVLPYVQDAANHAVPAMMEWHRQHANTIAAAAHLHGRSHMLTRVPHGGGESPVDSTR